MGINRFMFCTGSEKGGYKMSDNGRYVVMLSFWDRANQWRRRTTITWASYDTEEEAAEVAAQLCARNPRHEPRAWIVARKEAIR